MFKRSVLVLMVTFFIGAPSTSAAPLWIERQFIPKPELIDARFAQHRDDKQIDVDHAGWTHILQRVVVPGDDGVNRVRYELVKASLMDNLNVYVAALEAVDARQLTRTQALAYWINLYNAATVRMIAEQYPLNSIRDISVDGEGPWDHQVVAVLGQPLTLGEIEHHIVRAVFPDPRIHYALNCASIGCPNLAVEAYTSGTLESMLDGAATQYVNHVRGVKVTKGKAEISKIYGWYAEDFGDKKTDILNHLRRYASGDLNTALTDVSKIRRYAYDWSLNDVETQEQ